MVFRRKHILQASLLILGLVKFNLPVEAQQDASRIFSKYTTKNGLLINSIYDVAKSKNGMRWVGTFAGLQRFDGYSFENWTEPSDAGLITNPGVQQIYEDSEGNVWVSNFTYHYVFPAGNKKYEKLPIANNIPPPLLYLVFMKEQDGRLWCFESNRGIYGINLRTRKIDTLIPVSFQNSDPSQSASSIPFIGIGDDGTMWMSQDYSDSNYLVRFKPGEAPKIHSMPVDKHGRLKAFIPLGHDEFLFLSTRYAAIRSGDLNSPGTIISRQNIPGNFTRKFPYIKLTAYHKGNILFSGEKGLYEYDHDAKKISPFATSAWPEINLSRQFLFDLEEDALGNIWMSRDASDGLLIFHPLKLKFNFLRAPANVFNIVYSLAIHNDGRLISAGYQKGLNIFDKAGNWIRYVDLPGNEDGMSISIRCMKFIDNDHLLLKSLLGKLAVLDMRDYSIRDLSHLVPGRVAKLKNAFDANLAFITAGKLQTVHANYVLTIEKKGGSYEVQVVDSLHSADRITCSVINKTGQTMIGTTTGCYQRIGDQWQLLKETEGRYIKHMVFDSSGDLWVATINGILLIRNNKVVRKFDQGNGMLNHFVYGILLDDEGNAWYSSNKGLGCIRKNGNMDFYTSADGIQGDEFDTQSFCTRADGMMYFGGTNGITSFMPSQMSRVTGKQRAVISSIKINGNSYPENGRVEDITSLDLPYNQNAIAVDFSLSDFHDPEYIVYRARMQGFNDSLVMLRNIHSVQYLLPPGHYTLYVSGSNDGNAWSEEVVLPIVVHPAWWQTTWFRLLAGSLAVISVTISFFLFARRKTAKLKQQLILQNEMQKERERISRDLHDNIGAYSTAMIAGTEALESTVANPENRARLADLKDNARNILNSIRETIWLLNSRNLNVRGFMDGYINYCTNILRNYEGIEIEFRDEITENPEMSPATAINLLRIMQEILQNILKHSGATRISCSMVSAEVLSLTITDNGKGFDPENVIMGNGLANMKHRAKEIGFNIQIRSGVDGTEMRLEGKVT